MIICYVLIHSMIKSLLYNFLILQKKLKHEVYYIQQNFKHFKHPKIIASNTSIKDLFD